MSDSEFLPITSRLWLAWVAFFRVLLDGVFAARVLQARRAPFREVISARSLREPARTPQLPARKPEISPDTKRSPTPTPPPEPPAPGPALQLLAMLQREGRFIDFIEQDVSGFSDADVGVAARVVHEGCRKALRAHATLAPVMDKDEGAAVSLPEGYNADEVKLIGNVRGSAPFKGTLVHRGWRMSELTLPTRVDRSDATILAPAEVEL